MCTLTLENQLRDEADRALKAENDSLAKTNVCYSIGHSFYGINEGMIGISPA